MNSGMTYMIVGGMLAMVPVEHAEKIAKKELYAARAMELRKLIDSTDIGSTMRDAASLEFRGLIEKIVRLNRRIPACVQFV